MEEIKACLKKDLHKNLNVVPEKILRNTINRVMAENRSLDIKEVKFQKFVRQNEVKMIYEELGFTV
jgi:hypothetical protein